MKRISIYDLPVNVPEEAQAIYDDSSITLYQFADNEYWIADNQNSKPFAIGTAEDVIEYFMQFA
ncbi:MAG: hypothetical protein J6J59_05415 [Peptococcaceae bacterium]|nr:hypothetical protein [Peptococcaceae bacterium]